MAAPTKKVCENEEKVIQALTQLVIECERKSIEKNDRFTIGVSGGSGAKYFCNGLRMVNHRFQFNKWKLYFCDERVVPFDSEDSTYKFYKSNVIGNGLIPETSVYKIDPTLSAEEAAVDYTKKVHETFGDSLPRFDLLLLGMGPDGHTCSLFPGHPLLEDKTSIIAPITDSPKPPPSRVTMTMPVVNNCSCAVFAACGEGKSQMVKRVFEGDMALPAAMVRPTDGQVVWVLDNEAAKLL